MLLPYVWMLPPVDNPRDAWMMISSLSSHYKFGASSASLSVLDFRLLAIAVSISWM